MAGIYIHIPFCKKACHYCNFHFSTNLQTVEQMVDAICKESVQRKTYLSGEALDTIYFGGGTPSVLSGEMIETILSVLSAHYKMNDALEITLEANPDDLTLDYLKHLKCAGVNRLSVGVQSFFDDDLEWMNRSHDSEQAERCIKDAQGVGIEDLTLDLIFGCPDTDLKKWESNLKKAIDLDVPHVSCYGITVEEKTALDTMIKKGKTKPPLESMYLEQFNFTHQFLSAYGFEHYEISNYAKDKRYAVHNTNYWKQKKYLGLGPSAHSFDGHTRQWNIQHNHRYIQSIQANTKAFEKESLSRIDIFNESLMTGLRTQWGCSLITLEEIYPAGFTQFKETCLPLLSEGILLQSNERIYLSQDVWSLSDNIIAQLFVLDETD